MRDYTVLTLTICSYQKEGGVTHKLYKVQLAGVQALSACTDGSFALLARRFLLRGVIDSALTLGGELR